MTNINYLVNQLLDIMESDGIPFERFSLDDAWASNEASVYYNIACPYTVSDNRAHCTSESMGRNTCTQCKLNWLENEVDE